MITVGVILAVSFTASKASDGTSNNAAGSNPVLGSDSQIDVGMLTTSGNRILSFPLITVLYAPENCFHFYQQSSFAGSPITSVTTKQDTMTAPSTPALPVEGEGEWYNLAKLPQAVGETASAIVTNAAGDDILLVFGEKASTATSSPTMGFNFNTKA